MKKVFFFDIDGTLLPHNEDYVTTKTKYAISELQKLGHEVFIATGKSIEHASWVGEQVGVNNYVATNGQVLSRDGKLEYEKHFEIKELEEWMEIAKTKDAVLGFQGTFDSGILATTDELAKLANNYFKEVTMPYPNIIDSYPTHFKVGQLWLVGDIDGVNPDENRYHVVKWPHTGCDILPKGASKAVGIKYYIDNIDSNIETYGFGDGQNDIEMFQTVDNAIVMDNATDLVKTYAHHITKSCDEDGIYHYLVEQGIIGEMNE